MALWLGSADSVEKTGIMFRVVLAATGSFAGLETRKKTNLDPRWVKLYHERWRRYAGTQMFMTFDFSSLTFMKIIQFQTYTSEKSSHARIGIDPVKLLSYHECDS